MEQDLYDYDRLPTLNDEAQEIPDYTSLLDDCTVLALMADADLSYMLASTLEEIDTQTTHDNTCLKSTLVPQTLRESCTHVEPNRSPAVTGCVEPALTYAPHRLYATHSDNITFDENPLPHRISLSCAIPDSITSFTKPSPIEGQEVDAKETGDDGSSRETPPHHVHCLSPPFLIVSDGTGGGGIGEDWESGNIPQHPVPETVDHERSIVFHADPSFLERVPAPLHLNPDCQFAATNRPFTPESPTNFSSVPRHPIHGTLHSVSTAVPLLPTSLRESCAPAGLQSLQEAVRKTDTVSSEVQEEAEEILTKVGNHWVCLICVGTMFRRRTDLRRHMRGHSGQKTSCSKCGELFSRPDAMDRHLRDSCGQKRKRGPKPGSRRRRRA